MSLKNRILFSYSKTGPAALLSHLSLIEVISRALLRSALPVAWTEGFNPAPKLDCAAPLTLGISACAEIAITDMQEPVGADIFIEALNKNLPAGIVVGNAMPFTVRQGEKKYSAPAMLWGFEYENKDSRDALDRVPAKSDKFYRAARFSNGMVTGPGAVWGLKRLAVLAVCPSRQTSEPRSYFEVYKEIYPATHAAASASNL